LRIHQEHKDEDQGIQFDEEGLRLHNINHSQEHDYSLDNHENSHVREGDDVHYLAQLGMFFFIDESHTALHSCSLLHVFQLYVYERVVYRHKNGWNENQYDRSESTICLAVAVFIFELVRKEHPVEATIENGLDPQ